MLRPLFRGITLQVMTLVFSLAASQNIAFAAQPKRGYQAKVQVTEPTRLDWVFAVANQSPPETPAGWLADYDSTKESYELYVPANYQPRRAWPVMIFVSPGDQAMGYRHWRKACDELGIIFAGPHNAGNRRDTRERVRVVLDVLDEIRRTYNTDVDRTYISGFSGGGRIACAIAFALPEHFGGVVPICASGDLRDEQWLKQRVIDRLSVAQVTGETDFNRGEVELFRGPILAEMGVATRTWVVPGIGHAVPSGDQMLEVARWLAGGVRSRVSLAKQFPATRIPGGEAPDRAAQANALLKEAKQRTQNPKQLYSGLMIAKGIMARWPDLGESAQARELLLKYENDNESGWEEQDVAAQRKYLIARARGLSSYAKGPLPQAYARQQPSMAEAAINLWSMVIEDGQDQAAVDEGRRRIEELRKLLKKD